MANTPRVIDSWLHSKNFTPGRKGPYTVDTLVIHVMEGSEEAANEWFEDESSDVSANYGVRKDSVIERYVPETDTAWAQGRVDHPTAKHVLERPNFNPNSYCISIECEGSGKEPLTPGQKESVVWLINDIRSRWPKILLDRDHIVKHHEIYSLKTCPGVIDVDELVRLAQQPKLVYSAYFHDWLVVTRYVSDDEWYFIPQKEFARGNLNSIRAQTRLSAMPLHPTA